MEEDYLKALLQDVKLFVKSSKQGSHRRSNMILILHLCPMARWQPSYVPTTFQAQIFTLSQVLHVHSNQYMKLEIDSSALKYQNVFDNNVLVRAEPGNLLCKKLDLKFDWTFDYFHLTLCAERGKNCRSHKLTGFVSLPIF